jgi:prepilin-type N-terminal cleavage/methylation domain-containing protein
MLQIKRKKNNRGFTLMEMLIVVAIIAILAAIAIPTLTANLENAREAADTANEQNAKSVAAVDFALNGRTAGSYKFNADTGTLVDFTITTVAAYGQGTATGKDNKDHTAEIVYVTITDKGVVTTDWVTPATTTVPTTP